MADKLKLRIDWSELDYFGHVNNVAFIKYIQASRVSYWERLGLTEQFKSEGICPILKSISCHFIKPLFYPGEIIIHVKLDFIKNTSFGLLHQIIDSNNEIAAEAKDTMVMFDFNTQQKIMISDDLRKRMEIL
ncbi:MAG: acyl-CoA thioesterase [Flavisolibacter sp.]|nr:acyl-CoA thioesterase [Flavisolibacter sp.]